MPKAHAIWVQYIQTKQDDLNIKSVSKSQIGFRKLTLLTNHCPHSPDIIQMSYLHSSAMHRIIQWFDQIVLTFRNLVRLFNYDFCPCFCQVGPRNIDCLASLLNYLIDCRKSLEYIFPWYIDYTQAGKTSLTKLRHPEYTLIRWLPIAATITFIIKLNSPHIEQI
jgi:hypothetical protein